METRLEVPEAADAHVTNPENVTLQRALSARDARPVLLPKFLSECGIVDAGRIPDGAHGVGREASIREQPETECVDSGSGRLGEPAGPRDSILEPFLFQHAQCLSERQEERHGGRGWGVLWRQGGPGGPSGRVRTRG